MGSNKKLLEPILKEINATLRNNTTCVEKLAVLEMRRLLGIKSGIVEKGGE